MESLIKLKYLIIIWESVLCKHGCIKVSFVISKKTVNFV